MPKSKHKGIVPMIHIVKTLIKTTVKVMEKYIETRLNFYFLKKMLQLTSFDASKILYSSILSGGLSSWNIVFLREKKGTKPAVGIIYYSFIFLGYEDCLFLSLIQLSNYTFMFFFIGWPTILNCPGKILSLSLPASEGFTFSGLTWY